MTAPDQTASMLGKIAGYVEILSRDPQATVFVPLAETYRKMGLLDDALDVARKGTARRPDYAPGFTVLGRVLAQRRDLAAAGQAFTRAVEIDPRALPALKGLARVHALTDQPDRARDVLARASELAPDDPGIRRMLAGLPPAARDEAAAPRPEAPAPAAADKSAPGGARDPFATATLAEIYVKQGLVDRALVVYRDLLRGDPENERLHRRYEQLRQQESAAVETENEAPVAGAEDAMDLPEAGPDPAAPPVDEPPPADQPAAADTSRSRVVDRLNSWLDAIQRRRDDVR